VNNKKKDLKHNSFLSRLQKHRVYVIAFFAFMLILFLSISILQNVNLDARSRATDERVADLVPPVPESLWTFLIIGDTQAKPNFTSFDHMFPEMVSEQPDMMIHVGDLTWSDYKTQPLKGILDVQYWKINQFNVDDPKAVPVEIHITPGNHDNGTGGSLYSRYVRDICFGEHLATWDPRSYDDRKFHPFNTVVSSLPDYCNISPTTSSDRFYEFERGNIRFLILDMKWSEAQRNWFSQKVCEPNDASVTLAFFHDCDYIYPTHPEKRKIFLDLVKQCPNNNLKAVFTGHGHDFQHFIDPETGLHMVETQGFWRVPQKCDDGPVEFRREDGLIKKIDCKFNDFLISKVYPDRITFSYRRWYVDEGKVDSYYEVLWPYPNGKQLADLADKGVGRVTQPVQFLEIPGNFSEYFPSESDIPDDSVEPDTPEISPEPEESTTYELNIERGLSLIGIPVELDDIKASDFINQLQTQANVDVDYLASYQNSQWHMYQKTANNTFVGDDFQLKPGEGYLLYAKNSGKMTITGTTPILESSRFQDGWNLVSFKRSMSVKEKISHLRRLGVNVRSIFYRSAGRYKGMIFPASGEEFGYPFDIMPGQGYFIFVD